ncbi:hypothetical protein [Nonomuraea sp. SBT364]|uniref:hypothetical protein n=1 Tax=Nonomuraea sp. SBT364 TaxID=1580530 RepID=UPI00066E667A|nr:hypothetical protein [Nonomuraea sp. SBT364]
MRQRLAQALAEHPGAIVPSRVIDDAAEAARWGMHGSPTLLINGVDVFTAPGSAGGAPSVAALREALRRTTGPA